MGAAALPEICAKLVAAGMPASLPAAIIERGTTAAQRVVTATVATLPEAARAAAAGSPLLIVFGEVVALGERLAWFERSGAQDVAPRP